MSIPEHPAIVRIERTGCGTALCADGPRCSVCGAPIEYGECYGEWNGRRVCAACADDEWDELTPRERLERLGYDTVLYI